MKKVLLSLSFVLAVTIAASAQFLVEVSFIPSGTPVVGQPSTYQIYAESKPFANEGVALDWSTISITCSDCDGAPVVAGDPAFCQTTANDCSGTPTTINCLATVTFTPNAALTSLAVMAGTTVDHAYNTSGTALVMTCGSTYNVTGVEAVSALPIDLTSFEGQVQNETVNLKWQTASEFSNDFFTIERSYDGERFEALSEIAGAGDSFEAIDYTFTDRSAFANATSNLAYYRLMQTDFDGTSTYSDVVTVEVKGKNVFNIQNVRNEGATLGVNFDNVTEGNVTATIYDINGQKVSQTTTSAYEGYNSLNLDASQLNRGFYIINLTNGSQQVSQKFIF